MNTDGGGWVELGPGVFARRYAELDLTVGLVLGDTGCLVIDTRGDHTQGAEWAAAVRKVTDLPWTVALTHNHFDHTFGTSAFWPCPVWAHEGCHERLATAGADSRAHWAARYRESGDQETAQHIAETDIVLPAKLVASTAELSLGRRTVVLAHPGRGHTGNDLIVHVPDSGVVFAGDLLEHAAPGSFSSESFGPDSALAAWPQTLQRLLGYSAHTVVPGHGAPVTAEFVVAQRDQLSRLVALCTRFATGEYSVEALLTRSPFSTEVTRAALACWHG